MTVQHCFTPLAPFLISVILVISAIYALYFIAVPCFSSINFDFTVQIWKIWPLGHLVHQFMNAFTDHRDSDLLVVRCVNITYTACFATPNSITLINIFLPYLTIQPLLAVVGLCDSYLVVFW